MIGTTVLAIRNGRLGIVHSQGIRSQPGYLPWHKSPGAQFLAQDVAAGKNQTMPPRELYATRPEYQAVTLKQFRQFIGQEVGKATKRQARILREQQKEDEKKKKTTKRTR
jgi:hypothetical protein